MCQARSLTYENKERRLRGRRSFLISSLFAHDGAYFHHGQRVNQDTLSIPVLLELTYRAYLQEHLLAK